MPEAVPENDPSLLLEQAGWIRALARRLVLDPHLADDLSQETLLAALESPPPARGGLRGWLATVLRNKAASRTRSERRRAARERSVAPRERFPSNEEVLERAELHRRLVALVLELREPFRTTLLLRYFEGLDTERIAAEQHTEPATVRSRLKRALDDLRARLDAGFGTRRAWCLAFAGLAALTPREAAAGAAAAATISHAPIPMHGTIAGLSAGGVLMKAKTVGLALAASAANCGGGYYLYSETGTVRTAGGIREPSASSVATVAEKNDLVLPAAAGPVAVTAPGAGAPSESALPGAAISGGAAHLEGIVADENGKPVQGIVLHAVLDRDALEVDAMLPIRLGGAAPALPELDSSEARAVSDAAGRFRIAGLAPGRYSLVARGGGYRSRILPRLEAAPGSSVQLTVTMLPGHVLGGVVRDDAEQPVAGAEVRTVAGMFVQGGTWLQVDFVGQDAHTRDTGARTTTDRAGRFLLEGLGPGSHGIAASHLDWAPAVLTDVVAGRRDLELRLHKGAAIEGLVRDSARRPVVGAAVSSSGGPMSHDRTPSATTDAEGRFVLERVSDGIVHLEVSAEGYPRRIHGPLKIARGERLRDVAITLEEGATVAGLVLAPDGTAAGGARVRLTSTILEHALSTREATTGADGRFQIDGLSAMQEWSGYATAGGGLAAEIAPFQPGPGVVDLGAIQLGEGASVSGRITDEAGTGIAGARVHLRATRGSVGRIQVTVHVAAVAGIAPESASVETGVDGSYRLEGVEPGEYSVQAEAAGFATGDGNTLRLDAGAQLAGQDLVLGRGLRIAGSVADDRGRALPGVTVSLQRNVPHDALATLASTTSDSAGSFSFEHQAPGDYRVSAGREGYAGAAETSVAAGREDVRLELASQGILSGTVRDLATGEPVPAFSVKLIPRFEGGGPDFEIDAGAFISSFGGGMAFQDAEGRFEIPALNPGTYNITVRSAQHVPWRTSGVTIGSGESVSLDARLDRGGSIEGRVEDRDGKPIAGASVRFARSGEDEPEPEGGMMVMINASLDGETIEFSGSTDERVVTDGEGHYRIDGLRPGDGTVTVEHPAHRRGRSDSIEVRRGEVVEAGRVVLYRGGTIHGTVLADHTEGVSVHIQRLADGDASGRPFAFPSFIPVGEKGRYEKTGLEPGRYKISIHDMRAGAPMELSLDGEPGPDDIVVELGPDEVVEKDLQLSE